MKIVGIAATLRTGSYVNRLVHAAGQEAPPGTDYLVWDGLAGLPPFARCQQQPRAVTGLLSALGSADGLLLVTPELSMLPAELRHALDWMAGGPASRVMAAGPGSGVLAGKPVAVVTVSSSAYGGMWAQAELRPHLARYGGRVFGADLTATPDTALFDEDGRLAADRDRVRAVFERFRAMAAPRTPARPAATPAAAQRPVLAATS